MYLFSTLQEQKEAVIKLIVILIGILIIMIIRNWYNLYKKRSFRKENKRLKEKLEELKIAKLENDNKLKNIVNLEVKFQNSSNEVFRLKKEIESFRKKYYASLDEKERKIAEQEGKLKYQKKAYESYVGYKNVEANNTRLGAHFIKNVISQIYDDLEDIEASYKTFLGFQYKREEASKKIPSIKALKNIFKLLDYNVSALHKESITIEEELKHVDMFLDLISYLKPKAKTSLNNSLIGSVNGNLKIKPTLFFPFVENALKHGSLNDDNSFISIDLKETPQKQISYCLVNSIEPINKSNEITTTSNFGLKSLKDLIDTYYPGSTIECKELPNKQYLSELKIAVKK